MPIDTPAGAQPVPTRTSSGGFQTSEGTLYVSKPYRSRNSKKMKAVITFAPRNSRFDDEGSGANEFRGFYVLFWISIFIFTVKTYVQSIEETGAALNLRFATLFSRDAITLAVSDLVLVSSTAICVPFAKAVSKGWIKYYWYGVFIQHVFQITVLCIAVSWAFHRQWPWVQSGFLTLHSLVLIMKMHSYNSVNGYLKYVSTQADTVLAELKDSTESVGGWEKAMIEAKAHRAELDEATGRSSAEDTIESTPISTPLPSSVQTSYVNPSTANALRNRLNAVSKEAKDVISQEEDIKEPKIDPAEPHPLIDHPSETIAALATEYSDLRSEMVSTGPEYVQWPHNITAKNFAVYMAIPTLIYELEYPRTNKIRPLYVFEKTVATFGTFALLYTVTESFILPHTPSPGHSESFFRLLLDLALPFMFAYLLLFFIIFECICNAFAELSYFADRRFYDDWWNSTSQDEFSRKWNRPVHAFLLRHVYTSTMTSYRISKTNAMFLTFLLSACLHELVMVVVTHKFRMYLFLMQIIQIPLIAVSRVPAIKKQKILGNIVFWLGLFAGFPLLCVAYVAY